jgi:hypothetical protein
MCGRLSREAEALQLGRGERARGAAGSGGGGAGGARRRP